MATPLLYFIIGFLACFVGTLPFGPINLAVVKTTVDYDRRRGIQLAIAASIVEVFEALIAVSFGVVIGAYLDANIVVEFTLAIVFIALALYVFTREPKSVLKSTTENQPSFFRRGLLIAALNPQAIPFWLFTLALISQYFKFEGDGVRLLGFLLGVFVGKLSALYGFVVLSETLKTRLRESSRWVNRVFAAVLLIIGLFQAWSALLALSH